jgi:hypothetical protein
MTTIFMFSPSAGRPMAAKRFVARYDRAANRSVTSAEGLIDCSPNSAPHDVTRRVASADRAPTRAASAMVPSTALPSCTVFVRVAQIVAHDRVEADG